MVHFIPTHTQVTAKHVARLVLDHVFKLHGFPKTIVSDRDSKFTSSFWKELCQKWGIKQAMSTAFHPQTDGQTERYNRVLEEYLRHYINPYHDDWEELLPLAEFTVNNSYNTSVGATPFYLNYGQHPKDPVSLTLPCNTPAAEQFSDGISEAVAHAKQKLAVAQERQQKYANKHRREMQFQVGQRVMLSTQNIRMATVGNQKLLPRYVGPFPVIKKVGQVAYKLELPANMKMHPVFHVGLLKPYHSDGRAHPPAVPLECSPEGDLFALDAVLDYREIRRGAGRSNRNRGVIKQYLVKWKDHDESSNSWVDEKNLTPAAIQSYWSKFTGNPQQQS